MGRVDDPRVSSLEFRREHSGRAHESGWCNSRIDTRKSGYGGFLAMEVRFSSTTTELEHTRQAQISTMVINRDTFVGGSRKARASVRVSSENTREGR